MVDPRRGRYTGGMKYLVVPLLVALAGCAAAGGYQTPTATSDAVKAARLDYRICAVQAAAALSKARNEPARDVARTAVGGCESQLFALRNAVQQENSRNPYGTIAADAYTKKVRELTLDEVAAVVMKDRGQQ